MLPIYRALTVAGSAFLLPLLWLRSAGDPEARRDLEARLGRLSAPEKDGSAAPPAGGALWLQAVSVGEVRVAETFLRAARREHPELRIALSATTASGLRKAAELKGDGAGRIADRVFTFPLDLPWVVRRVLDRIRPAAYGSVETEIWPGLLSACGRRGIPTLIVNGSLSASSAGRWRWMAGAVRAGLATLRAACMQTPEDAERLLALGAPPESVLVTGNMKFDSGGSEIGERASRLRETLSLHPGAPVLLAGSTSPGEEEIVMKAWTRIRDRRPGTILMIAPRHRERFDAVAEQIAAAGHPLVRRSRGAGRNPAPAGGVILLDSIGELEAAYTLAEIAFVGGSLVPRGGQNPLEPARAGVPVLFGPGMDNFREVAEGLKGIGGAREVQDAASLAMAACELLEDGPARLRASAAAREFVESHSGATARTLQFLGQRIPGIFS